MSAPPTIKLSRLIDGNPISSLQRRVIVLCGLVALLDGFDLLAMGVAAPAIASTLQIGARQLGVVFSMALLGLMFGAFAVGVAADYCGRKRVLIGATVGFGLFTLCTGVAANLPELLLFRFLAGLGLGGAMPSFIALAAEYVPRVNRQTVISLLWTGFPLGGVIVGLLAPWLIEAAGWRSLFYIGGTVPLITSIVLLRALPNSPGALMIRQAVPDNIADPPSKIVSTLQIDDESKLMMRDKRFSGATVWQMFLEGRAFGTIALWAMYFATFLMLITNTAWTPTLLRETGFGSAQSSTAVAAFAMGSVIGTPLAGLLITRAAAHKVLPLSLIGSALMFAMMGPAGSSVLLVMMLQAVAGFCLGIASSGLIASAAAFYPAAIRSTGAGWAMGFGRLGSFAGPLAIGTLVGMDWHVGSLLAALGVPGLVAALLAALSRL